MCGDKPSAPPLPDSIDHLSHQEAETPGQHEVLAQGSFSENAWELKSTLAPELTQVLFLQLCGTSHLGLEMSSQTGQCKKLTRDETIAECIKVGGLDRRTRNTWPVGK